MQIEPNMCIGHSEPKKDGVAKRNDGISQIATHAWFTARYNLPKKINVGIMNEKATFL